MESLLQDLRFTLRTLRRTPAFPVTAIATLAIGIAATTAIFSTVNAALLKPLPYPNSEDLYSLRTTLTDGRVTTGNLAPVEIFRLHDPKLSVIKAAGLQGQDLTLIQNDGTPIKTRGYVITSGFFDAVRPADDARHADHDDAVAEHAALRRHLLSHLAGHVWRRSRRDRQAAAFRGSDGRRRRGRTA